MNERNFHWERFVDYRGMDLLKPFKFNNSSEGFESLVKKVEMCKKDYNFDKVIAGMEPSGHYWKALGWYLKNHEIVNVLVGV